VNPNPDLTEGVSFMESAEKAGISFSAALRQIVEFALLRQQS
jgi:D-alanine-D-alanine ligase-like ATP-grasp enzyme